jgi:hypothetical protein
MKEGHEGGTMIGLWITQFVRPVGGDVIPKDSSILPNGGYRLEDLPEGPLEVVTGSTLDSVGAFRYADERIIFRGTREDIRAWNDDVNRWW